MHQMQVLELTLWGLLATKIKPGATDDQVLAKLEKWNSTTLGQLLRGLKTQPHWPPTLVEQAARGGRRSQLPGASLPSRVLRRRALETQPGYRDAGARGSVDLARELSDELDAHLATLGLGTTSVDDLDEETRAEIDALRPTDWSVFVHGTDQAHGE
jgi:hypothetical protein